ncbi:MAG: hypothetical protein KJ604_20315 [Gammaproteobacteria bacterium]|nr:hypothetical protein [Gammaproteobacteria bacterium]
MNLKKVYDESGSLIIRFAADDAIAAIRFVREADEFRTPNGVFSRISLADAVRVVHGKNVVNDEVFGKAIELPCRIDEVQSWAEWIEEQDYLDSFKKED